MVLQSNKVIAWNVNDLNSIKKRRQVFHWLDKQKSIITCLQELHIKKSEKKYVLNKKLGEDFVSLVQKKKKRGV